MRSIWVVLAVAFIGWMIERAVRRGVVSATMRTVIVPLSLALMISGSDAQTEKDGAFCWRSAGPLHQ